ncbi:MAG TPA: glyoxalase superfamily protein [Candidatus Limnocylindrales bacterium]|nr:glyoxalase superfamily protein [Candidatus Limnocylindrales bacterium]
MADLIPFFRVADADASLAWYRRLGFEESFRHRFAAGMPLFIGLRRADAELFLSEHRGDAPPSSLAYLRVDDVESVAAEFGVAVEDTDYGLREVELVDPDGNRIRVGADARDA